MSFFQKLIQKVADNKKVVGTALGVVAAAFIVYKALQQQTGDVEKKNDPDKLELQKLKNKINIHNPSVGDLKQILTFTMDLIQKRMADQQLKFKTQRRKIKQTNFAQYLKFLGQGIMKLQQVSLSVQNQVLQNLGFSQKQFEQLIMKNSSAFQIPPQPKQLTLEQIKQVFKFQRQYLEKNGNYLCQQIKKASVQWDQTMKYMIPGIFTIAIADQIYIKFNFEQQQIEQSSLKYQSVLQKQLNEMRTVLVPLLAQFQSNDIQSYGNPLEAFDPSMMGGYDPHLMQGFNPDLNPQSMQEFEKMYGDPQMMAKLMEMMQNR